MIYPLYKSISGFNLPLRPLRVSKTACWCNKRCINMLCHVIFIFSHWDISDHFRLMMLWSLLLTVLSAPAWTIATVCCVMPLNTSLNKLQQYRILWHMLPASNAFSMQKSLHWPPVRQHAVLYKSTWKMENQDKTHYLVCAADQVQVVLV